jgi:hypothetical protein
MLATFVGGLVGEWWNDGLLTAPAAFFLSVALLHGLGSRDADASAHPELVHPM